MNNPEAELSGGKQKETTDFLIPKQSIGVLTDKD